MGQYSFVWNGMLTTKNCEQVANLMNRLLENKKFTFAISHQNNSKFKPKLRTDCSIGKNGVTFFIDKKNGKEFAVLDINDTTGVCSYVTNLNEDKYDSNFENPFFEFEGDKVTISYRVPGGALTYRVAALETC